MNDHIENSPDDAPALTKEQAVKAAVEKWNRQLDEVETASVSTPFLELSAAHPTGLVQLYSGRPTRLSSLVREPSALAHTRRKAREVISALNEQRVKYGFGQIHLAFGMAEWNEVASFVEPATSADENEDDIDLSLDTASIQRVSAPALLRPVTLTFTEDDDVEVRLESDLRIAPRFVQALQNAKAEVDEPQILATANTVHGFTPGAALAALHELGASHLVGFDMVDSLVIGQFEMPYEATLADIAALGDQLVNSDLVAALAGNEDALKRLAKTIGPFDKTDPDPSSESGVGDLDPHQHGILKTVRMGSSLLLDAAPSSAVESTVVAVLADSVARGRSTAFIPGDSRAASAIVGTLHSLGLDELVLDMTEPNNWRSNSIAKLHRILEEALEGKWLPGTQQREASENASQLPLEALADATQSPEASGEPQAEDAAETDLESATDAAQLDSPQTDAQDPLQVLPAQKEQELSIQRAQTASAQELSAMRGELQRCRKSLEEYIDSLHKKRPQWGVSAYDAIQVLTDLTSMRPGPNTSVRLPANVLEDLASDGANHAREVLQEAADLGVFAMRKGSSPWYGAVIGAPDKVPSVIERVGTLSKELLPVTLAHINSTAVRTGLLEARSLREWQEQLDMLEEVAQVLQKFSPEIFENSAADMLIATAPAKWRKQNSINMKRSARKLLVKQAQSFALSPMNPKELHTELVEVQRQRKIWLSYSGGKGYPRVPANLVEMRALAQSVVAQVKELEDVLSTAYGDLQDMHVDDLLTLLSRMDADEVGAAKLPDQIRVLTDLAQMGLKDLVDDLRERRVAVDLVVPELDLAWWASALSLMVQSDPNLSLLDGHSLNLLSEQFRALDLMQVNSLAPQLLRRHRINLMEEVGAATNSVSSLLQNTAENASVCLADLRMRYPLVSRLCPIWVVPPALVPQVFDPQTRLDVAVLQGVESVPMAQLLPVFGRADQVVAVGDSRRRRPGPAASLASVLPQVKLPPSRHKLNESVAAFLSAQGYGSSILSVPVPRATSSLSLLVVDGSGMPAPGKAAVESTAEEVNAVVNLVMEHARAKSAQSLAVVALNERHSIRLREAIIGAAARDREVDAYLRKPGSEPFTVVDAANAAGILRDKIILSVGYGKTPHGKVLHDFDVISSEQGPGLLVDALTTARKDLQLVSCIGPGEIDKSRLSAAGPLMLADLLTFAQEGKLQVDPIGYAAKLSEEESRPDRLLVDLAQRLFDLGLTVIPNFGLHGGMHIPLAVGHPDLPNELLVAVLTDTPEYAAEPSLRRRERHWAQRLEDYGWSVYMAYSMAVFMDPEGEAHKISDFVHGIIESRRSGKEAPKVSGTSVSPQNLESSWGKTPSSFKQGELKVERGPRPPIASGLPLSAYSDDQLDDLVAWITSDQLPRTTEQLVEELRSELGLHRRGVQIDAVLRNVATRN